MTEYAQANVERGWLDEARNDLDKCKAANSADPAVRSLLKQISKLAKQDQVTEEGMVAVYQHATEYAVSLTVFKQRQEALYRNTATLYCCMVLLHCTAALHCLVHYIELIVFQNRQKDLWNNALGDTTPAAPAEAAQTGQTSGGWCMIL